MGLNEIWFALFVVIISGYLILDGFDMGVGILHLVIARKDNERRILLNSIGPVWDGNEVWIVLGGGALFAAFPMVYASLFSGFYAAMMLVLLVMILRTCAIEFRSKRPSRLWRSLWDVIFSVSSLGLALLLGVAFANIISGVPIDASGDMRVTLLDMLNPFALLVGITAVAMTAAHGALFLALKTTADLESRVRRAQPRLLALFAALLSLVFIVTLLFRPHLTARYQDSLWPLIVPAGAFAALVMVSRMSHRGQYLRAFAWSSAVIALVVITAAVGMFPNMLVSSTDAAYNLTIFNAASEPNTLLVMLIIAVIGMPLVVLYTGAVYYVFRGKTVLGPRSY